MRGSNVVDACWAGFGGWRGTWNLGRRTTGRHRDWFPTAMQLQIIRNNISVVATETVWCRRCWFARPKLRFRLSPLCLAAGVAPASGPRWRRCSAPSPPSRPARSGASSSSFLGPGYLVAVGYMDPGNWATSLAGGSKFGYALLTVALLSNLMAILLQALCARLGIGAGRDLAQACRDAFPRAVSWPLWVLAEIAICATDLAEVIGTAIGLNLLFGIPLEIGVLITALDVFLILWMQNLGFRWIEAFIVTLLGVIAVCFADPDRDGRSRMGRGDPRLRADDRDRHQSGHALSRDRHHRRDRDAAQSLPALRRGADAALRRIRRRPARGDQARDGGFHHRADVRAADQCLDPDPRRRDLQQGRQDRRRRTRPGAFAPRADARLRHRADAVRHRAVVLRAELDGDGDAVRPDRDGRLSSTSACRPGRGG